MIRCNFLQSLKNSAKGVQSHLKFSFPILSTGNFKVAQNSFLVSFFRLLELDAIFQASLELFCFEWPCYFLRYLFIVPFIVYMQKLRLHCSVAVLPSIASTLKTKPVTPYFFIKICLLHTDEETGKIGKNSEG